MKEQEKPASISEYKGWLVREHRCELDRISSYYDSVANKAKTDLESGAFWIELQKQVREFNDQYLSSTGFPLHMGEQKLHILTKPYESFLLKTFRKNIVYNKHWPNQPDEGWFIPHTCFSRINDILRTTLVVKYLDGVQFLVNKMKLFCEQKNVKCRSYFEARETGYYAAHTYIMQPFEIPKMTWDTEVVELSVEVQITTQLQETIRKLLHKYYEEKRERIVGGGREWQWNYQSEEFSANYLGHILHYVEGMIMEIREKQMRGLR